LEGAEAYGRRISFLQNGFSSGHSGTDRIHGNLIADLQNTAALSSALTSIGIATWNIEYRRIDNAGGGCPGTFEDVANAVDYLRVLAMSYPLDLTGWSSWDILQADISGPGRLRDTGFLSKACFSPSEHCASWGL
jgi:hypothetical protein